MPWICPTTNESRELIIVYLDGKHFETLKVHFPVTQGKVKNRPVDLVKI